MAMPVRELELDLEAFEGPFDLLLALVLRDELDLGEVDVAGIVLAFLERLAEREELDLDACGEFLVLVAALLELKARALLTGEETDLEDLDPAEAAAELARRLAEYRRIKEAAAWLVDRLDEESDRYFRLGPAPLAPRIERRLAPQDPAELATILRALTAEPPAVSLAHLELRFPPVEQFLGRFRALLARRTRFDFDTEVHAMDACRAGRGLPGLAGAAQGRRDRALPGGAVRPDPRTEERRHENGKDNRMDRPLRLVAANPLDRLARTLEALLVVASQPLSVAELAEAAAEDGERVEMALGLLGERFQEGRSGIVLEQVAGGWAFRASREAAEACGRMFERPVERGLSQAAMETLAVIAYLGPCSRPEVARLRGVAADSVVAGLVERGLIAEAGREEGGAVRYRTTPLFERVFGLESLSVLPRLDDLGDADDIRGRLEQLAEKRPA